MQPDDGRLLTPLPGQPTSKPTNQPTPDTVTRRLNQLIDQPIHRSIMERHGLTRVPGSVYYDESGEVA